MKNSKPTSSPIRGDSIPGNGHLITAVGLQKRFGQSAALNGLSMGIDAGEVVAIRGRSGSGKSTLLLCLAGIIRPDHGDVFYDDQSMQSLSDRRLTLLRRTQFGFVFQFGQLVPELSAIENVSLPLRLARARRDVARRRGLDWLARLGVEEMAGKRPGEMSGGEAQRVAIARAMVTAPTVIFADEPTGSLDSANARQVMDLLTSAAREGAASIVLVTHEAAVAEYADRTVVIRDGVVAHGMGPHE